MRKPRLPSAASASTGPHEAARRSRLGRSAQVRGIDAEHLGAQALQRDGWTILARRLRTGAGEIDLVAERDGLLAFVEVKARPDLMGAAGPLHTILPGIAVSVLFFPAMLKLVVTLDRWRLK